MGAAGNRWQEVWTVERAVNRLGRDFVAQMLANRENAAGYCDGRAAGWWDANEPELHNAYKTLAQAIRAGICPLESTR